SGSRSTSTTRAPWRASKIEAAFPVPMPGPSTCPAPVTMATLPSTRLRAVAPSVSSITVNGFSPSKLARLAYGEIVPQEDGRKACRRQIRIVTPRPGLVVGALEDAAHHVRVTLEFGEGRVRSATGEAVRLPWATCPGAAAGLAQLQGTTLTTSLTQLR